MEAAPSGAAGVCEIDSRNACRLAQRRSGVVGCVDCLAAMDSTAGSATPSIRLVIDGVFDMVAGVADVATEATDGVATGAESGDEQEEGDAGGVCFHEIGDGGWGD